MTNKKDSAQTQAAAFESDDFLRGVKSRGTSPSTQIFSRAVLKTYFDTLYVLAGSGGSNSICDGRLTLATATPVTVTDQTAKTTVYFTPYKGAKIALYDGASAWSVISFAEASVGVPATTSTPFDVYAYNNSGTIALETTNWTNDTTRATALVLQDGVWVKTGATTRRYLGTCRTTTSSGQCEDSENKRFVWNYYNRVMRNIKTNNTTTSWTYATHAYREYNNGTGQVRGQFVVGVNEETYSAAFAAVASASATKYFDTKLVYDATDGTKNICAIEFYDTLPGPVNAAGFGIRFAAGYHYITLVEDAFSAATGTNYGVISGYDLGGALLANM